MLKFAGLRVKIKPLLPKLLVLKYDLMVLCILGSFLFFLPRLFAKILMLLKVQPQEFFTGLNRAFTMQIFVIGLAVSESNTSLYYLSRIQF